MNRCDAPEPWGVDSKRRCPRERLRCECAPCPRHDGLCRSCPHANDLLDDVPPAPPPTPSRISRDKIGPPLRIEPCGPFTREYRSEQRLPDEAGAGRLWRGLAWIFGLDHHI